MDDVIVVGSGPAGLSAAILLGRSRRKVVVIDAGEGRNQRSRQVNGYLGLSAVSPAVLRARGELQAHEFGVHFIDGLVTGACPAETNGTMETPTAFLVTLADGTRHLTRKLIFATGVRDAVPKIPGFHECYGRSVHHCPYCDGWEHRDGRLVAFSQSADAAVALAKTLLRWSDDVTVATHGACLSETDRHLLEQLGIAICEERLTGLVHEVGVLKALTFSSGQRLEADAVFFAASSSPCCDLPRQMGCRTVEKGHVETTDKQGTGLPGVFLAGDAAGDMQSAIVAAAEGAIAGMAVNKELHEEDLKAFRVCDQAGFAEAKA